MASRPPSDLIAGRECGACTACCTELTIDDAELKKVQGVTCPNCVPGKGCAIYLTRPSTCREWFCEWRRYAWLDDSWRPDRSLVVLRATDDDVPKGYASVIGVVFDILGPCEILLQPHVIEVVARMIDSRIATFLAASGLPGYASGRVFLNPLLDAAVRDRNGDALGTLLVNSYLLSVLQPAQAIVL